MFLQKKNVNSLRWSKRKIHSRRFFKV